MSCFFSRQRVTAAGIFGHLTSFGGNFLKKFKKNEKKNKKMGLKTLQNHTN